MMATKIEIRKFDISKMKKDCVALMVAKRRSGKSFLTRDLCYHFRDIPSGVIISPTEQASPFYGSGPKAFFPPLFVHKEYTRRLLGRFLKRQMRRIDRNKTDPSVDPRALMIMDDVLYDPKFVKDAEMRNIFFNGRHLRTAFFLLIQYSLGIPPALRSNIDYVFILREPNMSNRKKLYEHYAGIFPNFSMFDETLDKVTENFGVLVIDNTSQSSELEDCVFWYRAVDRPPFRFGAQGFWDYSRHNFDTKHRDREDDGLGKDGKKKQFHISRRS